MLKIALVVSVLAARFAVLANGDTISYKILLDSFA